jgi:hypothetical protein
MIPSICEACEICETCKSQLPYIQPRQRTRGIFDNDPIRGSLLVFAVLEGDINLVHEILQGISDEKLTEIIKNKFHGNIFELYSVVLDHFEVDLRPYESTALMCASQRGNVDMMEKLLTCGVNNINRQTDFTRDTPLMCAAQGGSIKAVQYLIQKKANIKITNLAGKTACDVAMDYNQYQVAGLLAQAESEEEKNTPICM